MSQNDNKIDAVYTWVNCEDAEWQQEFTKFIKSTDSKSASHRSRFRDNGELYFSLLSLEKFAPWINHIFIVKKAYQAPSIEHLSANTQRKIVFIDESTLTPLELSNELFYPTFNSLAIEANLHRIPGLSEKFIYFNNDMFLGNDVWPDYFFKDNKARFAVKKYSNLGKGYRIVKENLLKSFAIGHRRHLINSYELFSKTIGSPKQIGVKFHHILAHQCCPLSRSSYEYIWKHPVINEHLLLNSTSRFRTNSNIHPAFLASLVNLWMNQAKLVEDEDVFIQLEKLYYRKKLHKLCVTKPVRFCINDHPRNKNSLATQEAFSSVMKSFFGP